MVVQLHNMLMVEVVHDLDFKFYLLHQVMFNNLGLVDDFDSEDVLGKFVPYLVNFSKATYTDV